MLGVYTPGFLAEPDEEEGTLVNVVLYHTYYTDLMSSYSKIYLKIWMNLQKKERQESQE